MTDPRQAQQSEARTQMHIEATARALRATAHPPITWTEAMETARAIHARAVKQFDAMFGEERR